MKCDITPLLRMIKKYHRLRTPRIAEQICDWLYEEVNGWEESQAKLRSVEFASEDSIWNEYTALEKDRVLSRLYETFYKDNQGMIPHANKD